MQVVAEATHLDKDDNVSNSIGIFSFVFLLDETAEDIPLLTSVIEKLELSEVEYEMNFSKFFENLPKNNDFFHYEGS
jgi:hypothetical protein